MTDFNGFSERAIEILWGIRLNNNKEHFDIIRKEYKEFVHEPVKLFSEECLKFLYNMDKDFIGEARVSKVNRDIRFSKNKLPYKESKWFFIRDRHFSMCLEYDNPTFFFEIMPDMYRYGIFYSPKPQILQAFRKKVTDNQTEFRKVVNKISKLKGYDVSLIQYKKQFNKEIPEDILPFFQMKSLEVIKNVDYSNTEFLSREVLDSVCRSFNELYFIYKYFYNIY